MTCLTPSRQCYLAEILLIESDRGQVRPGELAARIKVNKSSVTAALRALAETGLIEYEPYGSATLTPKGRRTAEAIVDRWRLLSEFLIRTLDMDEVSAARAACRMQHAVPEAVTELISVRVGAVVESGAAGNRRHLGREQSRQSCARPPTDQSDETGA